jgi:D-tagatose-1,6-bisphosphate aldolase subunit GatZ/KbaZ
MSGEAPSNTDPLLDLVQAQKRSQAVGIYSVCSVNRFVIAACMQQAIRDHSSLLIESTSNQVNQSGGYSGMTPLEFTRYVREIAREMDFPLSRLIFGGDHLGPNPWRAEQASTAMEKARRLVQDCVKAGYAKIHLDASMYLGGDDREQPLPKDVSAARAAELCLAAEQADQASITFHPVYVIGTEVPPPGGAREEEKALAITRVEDARETIEISRATFQTVGLGAAWERVIALVVQPGVEFGDQVIHGYHRENAADLSRFIEKVPSLIYEAHSTDYQTPQALKRMVEDHFAILKVGPGLTFAFREAVFALAMIEKEWLGNRSGVNRSDLLETAEQVMRQNPIDWQAYYCGSEAEKTLARKYSLSDRIRYYWPQAELALALDRLFANLERNPPPLALVSQFLPVQYRRIRQSQLPNRPRDLVLDKIMEVTNDYAWACNQYFPSC